MHMGVFEATVRSHYQKPRAIARNGGPQGDQRFRQCKIEKTDIHVELDFGLACNIPP